MAHATKYEGMKAFLEQMYGKEIPDTELQEHKDRLVKFISLLMEIDMRSKKNKKIK